VPVSEKKSAEALPDDADTEAAASSPLPQGNSWSFHLICYYK